MPTLLSARRTSIVVAIAFGLLEIIMVPWLEEPVAAIVFAVLFLATAAWIARGGRGGLVSLAVLCALELAFLPFYPRTQFEDWIFQGLSAVIGVAGVVSSIAALRRGSRAVATS
ncbi:MAG TPA: hypothetical protein VFN76_01610 [Candidatus Limnocylindria bacterium]|nr:hypothetical protein [Candidatus Limnocylindria bacterium]